MAESMSPPASELDAARHALRETGELLRAAQVAHTKAIATFERAVEQIVKDPVEQVLKSDALPSEHRRAHRPGKPAKIDADPELRAFIRARIDRMTFIAIAEEVAKAFPPDRQVRKSAIYAWWRRNYRR